MAPVFVFFSFGGDFLRSSLGSEWLELLIFDCRFWIAEERASVAQAPPLRSAVLRQIRAFASKGRLPIVNPRRRICCGALMPEHSFTRDHREAALDFHEEVYGNSGETLPGGA